MILKQKRNPRGLDMKFLTVKRFEIKRLFSNYLKRFSLMPFYIMCVRSLNCEN